MMGCNQTRRSLEKLQRKETAGHFGENLENIFNFWKVLGT